MSVATTVPSPIPNRARAISRAGMSLLEATLAIAILATVLLASSVAFTASLSAIGRAELTTDGALYLETVMQDLSSVDYDGLLAMNGNQFFDGATPESSRLSFDLTVFNVQADLLQVEGLLTDRVRNRPLGRIATYRSRR